MAINFPNSPVNGQIHYDTTSGNRYVYDSTAGLWKFTANNDPATSTSNTQVLYNYNGGFYGSANLTFVSNTLYTNNIVITQNLTANYVYGNGAYLTGMSIGYYAGNNGDKGTNTSLGDIFRVHSNTLSQNVTIYSGNNALAAGPITVTGATTTLTIQTGARLAIV